MPVAVNVPVAPDEVDGLESPLPPQEIMRLPVQIHKTNVINFFIYKSQFNFRLACLIE
jgi:hypothetical protein